MWGRLSSLAQNPNLASLSQLTKDGIGQLSKITTDVLAEVKAAESRGQSTSHTPPQPHSDGDGWFGESDDEEQHGDEAEHSKDAHGGYVDEEKNEGLDDHHPVEIEAEGEEENHAPPHSEEEEPADAAASAVDDIALSDSLVTLNPDATVEQISQVEEEEAYEMKEPLPGRIGPSPTTSPSLSFAASLPSKSTPSVSRSSRQPSTPPSVPSPSTSSPTQLHRLHQQVTSLTSQLAASHDAHQRGVHAHADTRAQVDDLQAQLDELRAQMEEERAAHVEGRAEVESLQRLADERYEEVAAISQRFEQAKTEWEKERTAQRSQLADFTAQLKEQRRLSGAAVNAAEHKDTTEHSEAAYSEMVMQYLAEQARLEGELEEMREKYTQAVTVASHHHDTTALAVENTQQLQDEVAALQTQLEERDSTVYQLQSQLEEQGQQLDDSRQSTERIADLEAELQRVTDEAAEANAAAAGLQQEVDGLTTEMESREAAFEQERATLLQRAQEAEATPVPPSPATSPPPAVDQTAMITQLHQSVEKLRRIIHRLTTERNDGLTVIQSVQNGLMHFAEVHHIDVSEDPQPLRAEEPAEEGRKESEEERRRKIQTLVDKLLAGLQLRLQQKPSTPPTEPTVPPPSYSPPAASSAPPSPSLTALNSQLSALQSALAVERETSAARQAEVDKLRRVKEEMIAWKDKASAAMAKMKEEKKEREKALSAALQERQEEWEQRMYEAQQKSEDEVGALKGDLAELQDQLRTATAAAAHVNHSHEETSTSQAAETAALLAQRETEMEELQNTVASLTAELEELRGTVADYASQLEALHSEEASHQDKLSSLESSASTMLQQQDQLVELSSKLTQVTEEKRELNAVIQQHDASLHTLRTQLQVTREEAASRIEALEAEAKEWRAKGAELERELNEERERTERGWDERDEHWKAREDDYNAEREGYTQQIEELQRRLTEVQDEWKAQLDAQKEAIGGKAKETTKLMEEERKREKRERILLEGRIRELLEEREQERKEKEAELQELREGGGDRQKYEEQLSEKERMLQRLREERNAEQVAHLHAMKAMRDELEELKAQHADLQLRWQEQTEVEKELHAAISERQDQLQALQATSTHWQHRDEERDAEIAQLQVRCTEAEKERERLKAHMKEATSIIRQQYDDALQEIERQAIDIEGLRAQEEKGKAVADLCDQLSFQLEQKEGECRANVEALNNLQLVLEAVQAEHDGVKAHAEAEVSALREQLELHRRTGEELQEAQAMVAFLQSTVASLRSELLTSQSAVTAAQQEVQSLRATFTSTVERLKTFASDDHQIDRRLVVKLLVTFFERGQKEDTLQLMYRMLGLTEEEKERVERGRKGKGLGGRLYGLTSYVSMLSPFDTSSAPMAVDTEDANLTDLWVDFLLKEAKEAEQSKQGGGGGGAGGNGNGGGGGEGNAASSPAANGSASAAPVLGAGGVVSEATASTPVPSASAAGT